jgi:hypothetical protein
MRALITVKRGTKGLNVRLRCIGTAWSLLSGAILLLCFLNFFAAFAQILCRSNLSVTVSFVKTGAVKNHTLLRDVNEIMFVLSIINCSIWVKSFKINLNVMLRRMCEFRENR